MLEHGMNNTSFWHFLLRILAANWNSNLKDNFDHLRFGESEKEIVDGQKSLHEIEKYLDKLESFFFLLGNNRSQVILLHVLAFRIMGHRKIRLPLSKPEYWQAITDLASLIDVEDKLEVAFVSATKQTLYLADLKPLDLPIKLYTTPGSILSQFVLKPYEYVTENQEVIGAKPGDIVIDAGACWADTTLFFANKVKKIGRVYSFEFIPNNLRMAYKNIKLNSELEKTIKIIENPLWNESGVKMFYCDNGPGSIVSATPFAGYEGEVYTISIDDFVNSEQLNKVDLIKMDIEGAEQFALKGAENTLRKYKPQLAISVYHNMNDLANIVHLINDLNLGYKFYLNHFTIHYEETVLYGKV